MADNQNRSYSGVVTVTEVGRRIVSSAIDVKCEGNLFAAPDELRYCNAQVGDTVSFHLAVEAMNIKVEKPYTQEPEEKTESAELSQHVTRRGSTVRVERYSTPHYIQAMLSKSSIAAGRCGFLAGFAYYEFSRVGAANAERIKLYPMLLLACFSFAVLSAAINSSIQIYSRYVSPDALPELHAKLSPPPILLFGKIHVPVLSSLNCIAKFPYAAYRIAFMAYVYAMAEMGHTYNENLADTKALESTVDKIIFQTTWAVPLVLCGCFVLLDVYGGFLVSQLRRGTGPFAKDKLPEGQKIETAEALVAAAERKGGQALFMMGFVGHAMARYNFQPDGVNDDAWTVPLMVVYWVITNVVAFCMMIVVFATTCIAMQLKDMDPEFAEQGEVLAQRYVPVMWVARNLFVAGIYALLVAAGLMAWGTSQKCGDPLIPEGACYLDVWYVPASCCGVALIIVAAFRSYVRVSSEGLSEAEATEGDPASRPEAIIASLTHVGWSSTLASGFVMYNIATFDTDVIRAANYYATQAMGLTWWGIAFFMGQLGGFRWRHCSSLVRVHSGRSVF
mmetsp:Transcript_31995/g.71875  ORF Transcript_31995/g.71875 Transcript_31995/m.71875 type:complete len:561 (+) Transcript_31995:143-1825(+)